LTEVRIWILSDLHLESTRGWDLPSGAGRPHFDVLVVAGDLVPKMERGVAWLRERVLEDVVYIAGNHEAYGVDVDRTVEKAKEAAAGTSIHVIQNETVRIGDVTFAGATLWTDFELMGDRLLAMRVADERMNDFRRIRVSRYVDRFRPHHALERHQQSRAFLEAELRKERPGPMVIVTHHGAHRAQQDPTLPPDILVAAYRSDLTHLMVPAPDDGRGALRPADLWIYGHTHEFFDGLIGSTRVVSNAKGYGPLRSGGSWDNPDFNPNFVIEI
jgi:predicted phosphodiesterase